MKPNQETFGIHRTTLIVFAIAVTFGSFSVYKALGGGSTKVAATLRVPSGTVGRTDLSEAPALSNLGSAVVTKADAARPAVKTDLTPIEQIQVGDRVLAESPTGEEDTSFGSEIIPSDWRKLTLRAPKRDWTVAEVVLLRPLAWLNEQHGEVGGTVFISVPECGIDGNAEVLAIDPCPEIPSGAGRVVTGTFLHRARSTITLTIVGQSEPIECTGNHPFWSEDRQTFVRADSLQPNETLRTATGLTTVESWTPDLNPTPVYNIEVHGTHVYHVGTSGVVVHNADLPWFAYEAHVLNALGFSIGDLHKFIRSDKLRLSRFVDIMTGLDAVEITKIDFNSAFESLDDFRVLQRKIAQLELDGQLLREGKLRSLLVVTPDVLPTTGRGAQYTRKLLELRDEFGKGVVSWRRICP